MSDNSKKVSQLPIATDLATTDRVVILRDPSGSPSVRTITKDNLTNSLRYANSSVSGVVKVGDYLTVNATGYLNASNPELANNASYLGGYAANQYAFANAGMSISDFGEGFSLTASDKIVTNKLYSTNESQSTQHYRFTLDTNGVIHLPDESIINGATLKTVSGVGTWAGLTAGPDSEHSEDSWMWVDSEGAWIGTDYSNNGFTWQFNNDGGLTLPGDIQAQEGNDINIVVYNPTVEGTPGGVTFSVQNRDVMTDSKTTQFDVGPADIVLTTDFTGASNEWTFGTDGTTKFPNDTIKPGNGIPIGILTQSGNVYTQINQYPNNWEVYSEDDTTAANPGWAWIRADLPTVDTPKVFIENQKGSDGVPYRWTFGSDGRTTFPSPSAPVHSYGIVGDKAGMISFDASYIYYCTADYVDDVTDIWKRIAWPGDTW